MQRVHRRRFLRGPAGGALAAPAQDDAAGIGAKPTDGEPKKPPTG
jgi:hypothetical protein